MKINEVSKKYGLSCDTLRYYEKIGLIDSVSKENGIRDYTPEDLNRIEFIKCMRLAGLSIKSLLEYIELYHEGDDTIEKRKNILIQQRDAILDKMSEIQFTLDKLNHKIQTYDDNLRKKESKIKQS